MAEVMVTGDGYSVPRCPSHLSSIPYQAESRLDAALEEARRYREALETISADNPPLSTDSTSMAHSPDHNILVEALAEIGDFARSALVSGEREDGQ